MESFHARIDPSKPERGLIYDLNYPKFSQLPKAYPNLRFIVGACGTKFGKLEPLTNLIPTPHGFKKMGDIHVGDYVFDEQGQPTKVVYETPVHERKCYEVVFQDGASVIVGAEHLWLTETHACRKACARVISTKDRCKSTTYRSEVRDTEEIRRTLLVKNSGSVRPNHSIPVCEPVHFPEQTLLIDPYVLGAWLGDGTSSCGNVTGIDERIHQIVGTFYERYQTKPHAVQNQTWSYRGLSTDLRTINVLHNKHVPLQYLIGSVEQRIALLQGLMDTDGTISKRGDCSFYNTNKLLADAVYELVCSLGIKATRESRLPKINGSRHQKNGKEYPECHIVHFTTNLPVFRLQRKLERIRPVAAKAKRRYIVDVRPAKSVPAKCIRVDNPKHLYLTSQSYIVTHNTYGCGIGIIKQAWDNSDREGNPLGYPGLYWWVAPTYAQSKNAYRLIRTFLPKGLYDEQKADLRLVLKNPDGSEHSYIEFKSAENDDNLRGFAVNFFVFDEAARGVSYDSFISVLTTVTQTYGSGIIISTPKGRNWFYDIYNRGDKSLLMHGENDPWAEWLSIRMPTWSNPHVKAQAIADMKNNLPLDVFEQEVAARFKQDGVGAFRNVEKCVKGVIVGPDGLPIWESPNPGRRYVLGVDLARKRDYTVIVVMDTERKHVVYFERFNQIAWQLQKHRIAEISRRYNNALICLDSTGVGDPILEDLTTAGCPVEAFIFSNKSKQQLIDKLRVNIEFQKISYPEIPVMVKELIDYEFEISSNGNIKYAAPTGRHDDTVIALALANWVGDRLPFKYSARRVRGV